MKKVLIISYYWPPSGGSGVQRWFKFSKFLPKYGIKPYIYTPKNPTIELNDEELTKQISNDVTASWRWQHLGRVGGGGVTLSAGDYDMSGWDFNGGSLSGRSSSCTFRDFLSWTFFFFLTKQ